MKSLSTMRSNSALARMHLSTHVDADRLIAEVQWSSQKRRQQKPALVSEAHKGSHIGEAKC
jgi:hypothetical protein